MLYKIADLIVEVPEAGGLAPRCRAYLHSQDAPVDIVIKEERYHPEYWPMFSTEEVAYIESGNIFYAGLLRHNGLMLHASAVAYNGKAYLFSGPCGMGKSTHTSLWQQTFGPAAEVFNDDKPALRRLNGKWYAYGTPWCGKDGINQNKKIPLAGICFLKQAETNKIRTLEASEAITKILAQTLHRFKRVENLDLLLGYVECLVNSIPVFELENRPNEGAVLLSYETMFHAAEEKGL